MDDVDSKDLFGWKFGPTVLQVTAGVYSGFLWGCKHPNSGVRYAEFLDNDFIIDAAKPYLGRFVSTYADLS
jgi:homospermidine synthase